MSGRTLIPPGTRSIYGLQLFADLVGQHCRSRCDLRLSDVNKLSPFRFGSLPKHLRRRPDDGLRRFSQRRRYNCDGSRLSRFRIADIVHNAMPSPTIAVGIGCRLLA